jgi:hypothetical protein
MYGTWNLFAAVANCIEHVKILPEATLQQLENCRCILAPPATSISSLNISTLKTASALPGFLQSNFKMPAKS